jgi:hypothetical protein
MAIAALHEHLTLLTKLITTARQWWQMDTQPSQLESTERSRCLGHH